MVSHKLLEYLVLNEYLFLTNNLSSEEEQKIANKMDDIWYNHLTSEEKKVSDEFIKNMIKRNRTA